MFEKLLNYTGSVRFACFNFSRWEQVVSSIIWAMLLKTLAASHWTAMLLLGFLETGVKNVNFNTPFFKLYRLENKNFFFKTYLHGCVIYFTRGHGKNQSVENNAHCSETVLARLVDAIVLRTGILRRTRTMWKRFFASARHSFNRVSSSFNEGVYSVQEMQRKDLKLPVCSIANEILKPSHFSCLRQDRRKALAAINVFTESIRFVSYCSVANLVLFWLLCIWRWAALWTIVPPAPVNVERMDIKDHW